MRRNQQPVCIGQKQRWFLLRLKKGDVTFDFRRTSEPEFDQWRWSPYWEPVKEVIYFKRAVYARALTELARTGFPARASSRRCREWWERVTARQRRQTAAPRGLEPRCASSQASWPAATARRSSCASARRWCAGRVQVAAPLIGLFALYVVYELGRYNAGYDRQAVAQQRTELEVQIEHLEKADRELRTQLAEADTITAGRAHEQAEVARTIGDLQAQVARQSQELAFYRGVVAQNADEHRREDRAAAHHRRREARQLPRAPVAGARRTPGRSRLRHRALDSRRQRRRRRKVARPRRPHRRPPA